jgi:hypothetical protein
LSKWGLYKTFSLDWLSKRNYENLKQKLIRFNLFRLDVPKLSWRILEVVSIGLLDKLDLLGLLNIVVPS